MSFWSLVNQNQTISCSSRFSLSVNVHTNCAHPSQNLMTKNAGFEVDWIPDLIMKPHRVRDTIGCYVQWLIVSRRLVSRQTLPLHSLQSTLKRLLCTTAQCFSVVCTIYWFVALILFFFPRGEISSGATDVRFSLLPRINFLLFGARNRFPAAGLIFSFWKYDKKFNTEQIQFIKILF